MNGGLLADVARCRIVPGGVPGEVMDSMGPVLGVLFLLRIIFPTRADPVILAVLLLVAILAGRKSTKE